MLLIGQRETSPTMYREHVSRYVRRTRSGRTCQCVYLFISVRRRAVTWTMQLSFGSALHLPFKSTTSLPLSGNSSMTNIAASGRSNQGLKRPPSSQTLSQGSRAAALSNIQHVIVRYAAASQQNATLYAYLPMERDVLSVLLMSFLNQSTGRIVDEERRLSLEIFETVIRTWRVRPSELCSDSNL